MQTKISRSYYRNQDAVLFNPKMDVGRLSGKRHAIIIDGDISEIQKLGVKTYKAEFDGFTKRGGIRVKYRPGYVSVVHIDQILIQWVCGTPPPRRPWPIPYIPRPWPWPPWPYPRFIRRKLGWAGPWPPNPYLARFPEKLTVELVSLKKRIPALKEVTMLDHSYGNKPLTRRSLSYTKEQIRKNNRIRDVQAQINF